MLGDAGGVEKAETFVTSHVPFAEGKKPGASLRGPGLGGEGRQLLAPVLPETAPPATPLPLGAPLLPVVVGSPLDVKLCVALSGRGYLDRC